MPQQENTERTAMLITVGIVVVLALLGGGAYFLGHRKLVEINRQKAKFDKQIRAAQDRIDKIPGLQEQFEKKSAENEQYIKRLPDTTEIDSLLRQISETTSESNMVLLEIKSQRERHRRRRTGGETEAYQKFIYTVELQGDYKSFVDFVHKIEYEMPRFFTVEWFSIDSDSDGLVPGSRAHTFQLQIVTYAFSRPEISGKKG